VKIEEKKQITEDLKERLSRCTFIALTHYKGLDVAAMGELRRKLRAVKADFRVAKNTLLRRAAENTWVQPIQDRFKGPSGVAFCTGDPVESAKVLTEFADAHKELEIQAGVLGERVLDAAGIKAISSLPAREVLLGQMLSVMVGVPTGLVRALSDVPRRFLNVLNQIREQKGAA